MKFLLRLLFFSSMILLGISTTLYSQVNYVNDTAFFNTQVETYNEWLRNQNLSTYFEIREPPLRIRKNSVRLYLNFLVVGEQASINAIDQLKDKYLETTGIPLNESLFLKAIHLFEVPPKDFSIRIENESAKGQMPGVEAILRYRSDSITNFSILRSEVKDSIVIEDFDIPDELKLSMVTDINDVEYRKQARKICLYLKNKAIEELTQKGEMTLDYPIGSNSWNFSFKNLKGEVIEPGILSWFDPHEKLSFYLRVLPGDNNGLQIFVHIDGKVGPSLGKPRSGDYHEMHPQYVAELNSYIERFTQEKIYKWIQGYSPE